MSFERKLSHYSDERDAIERRKEALLDIIDYDTNVNSLLKSTDMVAKVERGEWGFGDIEVGEDFIAGRLAKKWERKEREPDDEVEGYPPTDRDTTETSFFVINLSVSVMAFEFKNNIGDKAPYRILRAAFNSHHDGEEKISFSPLVDKAEVREAIEHLKRITEVRFSNLQPTNPDSTDRSEPMDEFLQKSQIDRLMLDGQHDGDDGIQLEETLLLDGGLSLAEEGYGSALITGVDREGEEKHVSTDENPIESEVNIGDSDEVNRQKLMEEIRDALDRLED